MKDIRRRFWLIAIGISMLLFTTPSNAQTPPLAVAYARNVVITNESGERGSGVIVGKNKVLTNFHLLCVGASTFVNGKLATIIKVDTKHDLLLLGVETADVPDLTFAKRISVDEEVMVFGNPLHHTGMVLRGRIVDIDDTMIYTDAHIFFGSSGGGVWNMNGELVGLSDYIECEKDAGCPYAAIIPVPVVASFLSP